MRTDLWGAEDDEIVRARYATQNARTIQPLLTRPRTESAIRSRANKLGCSIANPKQVTHPQWINGRRTELARLAGSGLTSSAIAAVLGTTKNAIIGALYRHDIDWPRRGLTGSRTEAQPTVCNKPEPVMTGCRWLDGEPKEFRYCAQPQRAGSSYCTEHHKRCWMAAP